MAAVASRRSIGCVRGTIPAIPAPVTPPIQDPALVRVRTIARVLDTAIGIPGTKMRFGLDPIMGLIPGLGDVAGAVLSGYIVLTGIRLGAPRSVVARKIGNEANYTLLGSVPVLGDLFDASWKSNQTNGALLERPMGVAPTSGSRSKWLTVGGVVLLILLAVAGAALAVGVFRLLVGLFRH
jgi:hypothetical protein